MRYFSFILASFLFPSFASACTPSDSKYVGYTTKIVNVEASNVEIKHSVGGSVTIVSGCSFSVRNMTLIPSGNSAYWWGVPIKSDVDPYPRVVPAALGSYNGQEIVYNLDPRYSFDNFSIMEIFSEGDSRPYGAFAISGNVSSHYGLNNANGGVIIPSNPYGGNVPNSAYKMTLGSSFVYSVLFGFSFAMYLIS